MYRDLADAGLLGHVPDEVGPRKMAFRGGAVHWRQSSGSQEFPSTGHSIAIMLADSPKFSFAFESEPYRTFDAAPGMIAVRPFGVGGKARWSSTTDGILVVVSPESMLELAGQEFDRPDVDLRPVSYTADTTALQFAKMIKAELNRPDHSNELYLDSLITVLGVHVLRNYSNAGKLESAGKRSRGGLSASAAARIRNYLHEHFSRKLTTSELAAICGLSVGHFTQAFSKTFGCPPYRYVLERRLDFAEKMLSETTMPVAEVAFLSGFSSQSHLTNMMKTYRRKTPSQLR